MHTRFHWKCCWQSVVGNVLWGAAMVAVVLAWVAMARKGLIFGLEPLAWYWNALVLGVLSIGASKSGCGCGGGVCAPQGE
ncbi:MAG: hypothetical protein Q8R26_01625 [bacterium]|nr:hypothetical protein [bacterium]